jgi:EAL domain-containing protein (putative c-di-GMP-specific phosphodiesterase class I)
MPGRRPGDLLVSEDAALVRSVVDPGHELGMTIVAEGAEHAATAGALR